MLHALPNPRFSTPLKTVTPGLSFEYRCAGSSLLSTRMISYSRFGLQEKIDETACSVSFGVL